MNERKPVYIHGVAIEASWRDGTRNLGELIFDVVHDAVEDSRIPFADIDSVVLAAHDVVDGRSLSSMVTAPSAGAYLRDEIRFGEDGASALAAAMTRVESGDNTHSIVAAWGRASEGDPEEIGRSLFDPGMGRPLGLDELMVSALRAQRWINEHGSSGDRELAAEERSRRAAQNPWGIAGGGRPKYVHYPLTRIELPVWGDFVAAIVISSEPSPIRIAGLGQSSESFHIGDRDLLKMPALAQAVSKALEEAGRNARDIDVFEIDGLTAFDEAIALEAIGLAKAGQGFRVLRSAPDINRSGGSGAGYCAPAMGLVRTVEAVARLRDSGRSDAENRVRTAVATGSSTVASQIHTAVVLEAE